jgi:serine/threonine protein kinase
MIDCIAELHQNGVIHRDIKPQNFLRHGHNCVVSDLGLCVEHDSSTIFTRQSQTLGNRGICAAGVYRRWRIHERNRTC